MKKENDLNNKNINNDKEVELKIIAMLDKIRPYLIGEGGDINFIKYENNIVYVKMTGACAGCSLIDVTLNDGIKEMITTEIPEVIDVINVDQ